jgi:hypothetical protein
MFDPWQQSRLNAGLDKVKSAKLPERDTSIDDLKRLSGVNKTGDYGQNLTHTATDKAEYMRKNNIKPGTEEWFKLWYAQPYLTGESPYNK